MIWNTVSILHSSAHIYGNPCYYQRCLKASPFSSGICICWAHLLTHWGRVTHICVGKQTIMGSDNGLSPGRRQAIIWTNAGILLTEPLRTNFSDTLIKIQTFSFKKMYLKISPGKWRPYCLGLNVLKPNQTRRVEIYNGNENEACVMQLLNLQFIKRIVPLYFVLSNLRPGPFQYKRPWVLPGLQRKTDFVTVWTV